MAATALIAVMANVALPSGVALAQHICNVEYAELSGRSDFGECCSSYSADTEVLQVTELKGEFCETEVVCEQELATVFSETHVTLSKTPQFFASLSTTGSTVLPPITNIFTSLILGNAVPFSKPPLFLLNSTFLI